MPPKKTTEESSKPSKTSEKAPVKKTTLTKKTDECSTSSNSSKSLSSIPQALHSHPDHPAYHDGHSGGCCGSKATGCSSAMDSHAATSAKSTTTKKGTRVVVQYDVGFKNALYIRGNSCDLTWEKGKQMKNEGPNRWVWETDKSFTNCEFKVLINDKQYECGENQRAKCGSELEYTPKF
jgi:hypothetical protein